MLRSIFNTSVNVSERTKAVLDRLGMAREYLQTIMKVGVIASEVSQ
jgi:hypothetical protein